MRRLLQILTGIALALGAIHLALAALGWRVWSVDALWFVGAGLAILIAGLLNVVMMRTQRPDRVQQAAWIGANVVAAGFFALAWTVLPAPQVVVGGLVFALLALGVAGQAAART